MIVARDKLSLLDKWRRSVLAPPEGTGKNPGDVEQRLREWITEVRPQLQSVAVPEETPYAVCGTRLITMDSTGEGESWQPGSGAQALCKALGPDLANEAPGFNGTYAYHVRTLLKIADS